LSLISESIKIIAVINTLIYILITDENPSIDGTKRLSINNLWSFIDFCRINNNFCIVNRAIYHNVLYLEI